MKTAVFVDLLNLFWDQHGICSMAGVMRNSDIDVHFVGTCSFKKALKRIAALEPDVLLYSAFSATIPTYIAFDRLAKQSFQAPSVIGGPGATYDWKDLADSTIDAVCVGEGEQAIVDYIRDGFVGGKNIFPRGQDLPSEFYPLVDLDELPFPDRSALYAADSLLHDAPSKQFLSGRGCPYHCTYCFNHKFREMFKGCGPVIRKKSVDYLLDEIRHVGRNYPLANVVFNDDTFILDKKWFLEFCERFPREIGLPYTCNVRANLVDEEIAEGLRDSNCRNVNWSIESGNEFLRNEVLRRRMSDEQILRAAELLRRSGIQYRIGNVIGLPGESFEQMLETVDLNIRAQPYMGLANIFVPFPGLELTKYARDHGHYAEVPQGELPRDYFTRSVMNISENDNRRIYKLMCLFPVFVSLPSWFRRPRRRKFLFGLPRFILRVLYEIIYTWKMSRMYVVKTPLWQKVRMAIRYLRNL